MIGVPRPSPFFVLFRCRVLYWTRTEERKRGGLGTRLWKALCRLRPHRAHIHVILSRKTPLHNSFTVSIYWFDTTALGSMEFISISCFALEALLWLLNTINKFTISLGSIWIYNDCLFFVNTTVLCFHTLQTMHLPLVFLSHLSSLLLFLKKKKQEQVTKKFSEWKQAHVGMEPSKTSQTRWERHNTFTPSLHLVPFYQLCTTQNSLLTH